ncbi:MAG TPA: RNA polymerase sigma factor [Candidatus Acidoferrales bacterium]|nr:RNA polymerase sigma factor [Candidatus Acidoferrales bacterium]
MTDFESLYERHAPEVRRFAMYLCGDPATADEITSDTFVKAWLAVGRIREPTVKSYLFSIARNLYLDSVRRGSRHTELDPNLMDARSSTHTQLEQKAELRAALAELKTLPEIDRTALMMRALEEMPYEEIAAALDISVVTAKVKVHRARMKLMQKRDSFRQSVSGGGTKQ